MIKSIQLVFVFFLLTMIIGSLPLKLAKEKHSGLLTSVFYGTIIIMALFEIIVVPMTMMGQTLTKLTQVWSVLILVIGVFSLIYTRDYLREQIKRFPEKIKHLSLTHIGILFLIFVQIFICVKYIFLHANDAYYVGMAATTLNTDRLLAFSPYTGGEIEWVNYKSHVVASLPAFWAMLSKLFGVSAAQMCHTIVPIMFIPIGYILYKEIGVLLFKGEKGHIRVFLLLLCIGNFFIGKNYDFSYEMLSTSIWQGGTFLANIVLPGIFYFEFKLLKGRKKMLNVVMVILMLILGAMTVPKSGLVLSLLVVIVLGLSFTIDKLWIRRKRMHAGIDI